MFDSIAEKKIAEAMERGEFDDLPGAGRPLELDDDANVPEDLRVAYRILKNAGFVPPEVERLVDDKTVDNPTKAKLLHKIALLRGSRGGPTEARGQSPI